MPFFSKKKKKDDSSSADDSAPVYASSARDVGQGPTLTSLGAAKKKPKGILKKPSRRFRASAPPVSYKPPAPPVLEPHQEEEELAPRRPKWTPPAPISETTVEETQPAYLPTRSAANTIEEPLAESSPAVTETPGQEEKPSSVYVPPSAPVVVEKERTTPTYSPPAPVSELVAAERTPPASPYEPPKPALETTSEEQMPAAPSVYTPPVTIEAATKTTVDPSPPEEAASEEKTEESTSEEKTKDETKSKWEVKSAPIVRSGLTSPVPDKPKLTDEQQKQWKSNMYIPFGPAQSVRTNLRPVSPTRNSRDFASAPTLGETDDILQPPSRPSSTVRRGLAEDDDDADQPLPAKKSSLQSSIQPLSPPVRSGSTVLPPADQQESPPQPPWAGNDSAVAPPSPPRVSFKETKSPRRNTHTASPPRDRLLQETRSKSAGGGKTVSLMASASTSRLDETPNKRAQFADSVNQPRSGVMWNDNLVVVEQIPASETPKKKEDRWANIRRSVSARPGITRGTVSRKMTLIEDKDKRDMRWDWNQLLVGKLFLPYRRMISENDEYLPDPDELASFSDNHREDFPQEVLDAMLDDGQLNERETAAFIEGFCLLNIKVRSLQSQLKAKEQELEEKQFALSGQNRVSTVSSRNLLKRHVSSIIAAQGLSGSLLRSKSGDLSAYPPHGAKGTTMLQRSVSLARAGSGRRTDLMFQTKASSTPGGAASVLAAFTAAAKEKGDRKKDLAVESTEPKADEDGAADAKESNLQKESVAVTEKETEVDNDTSKTVESEAVASNQGPTEENEPVAPKEEKADEKANKGPVESSTVVAETKDVTDAKADVEPSPATEEKSSMFSLKDLADNPNTDEHVKRLLQELEEAEKRQKKLEKQLQQAGVVVAEDIPYDEAKRMVAEIAARMGEIGGSDVTHPDKEEQAKLREEYFKLEQDMEKFTAALMLTDEWVEEQEELERRWEEDNAKDNEEALLKLRRHMPPNIRNLSEAELKQMVTPNGKTLPHPMIKKFKRTNVLMLLRINPDDIVKMHPSTLENFRVTGMTLTERRAVYSHLKEIGPRWKSMQADKMTERKWTWFKMMRDNFKENLESYLRHVDQYGPPGDHPYATRANPDQGCPLLGKQCPLKADKVIDYDGDYGFTTEPGYEVTEVQKSDADDPGAKAKAEAMELAREKKAVERSASLKAHYKGKLLQVSLANGSCEAMDEVMENIEGFEEKWIKKRLEVGKDITDEVRKKEISGFNDALNELKLAVLQLAERSGMQLTGKRDANADNPDIRSAIELGLSEEVYETADDFFNGIDERMNELKAKDGRLKSSIEQLRELMEELHERNVSTLESLGVERPEKSRKRTTRAEITAKLEAEMEAEKAEAEGAEQESSGYGPPMGGGGRGGLLADISGRGRGPPGGGRGGLMDAIAARGRGRGGGGGRGGLMDAIAARGRGRGGGDGGRGGLMDAIAARGRGRGGGDGGRGGLMDAIAARGRGGGRGRDSGRGGLLDAIAARGRGGGNRGGGGRGGLMAAIEARGRGRGGDGDGGGGRGSLMAAIAARGKVSGEETTPPAPQPTSSAGGGAAGGRGGGNGGGGRGGLMAAIQARGRGRGGDGDDAAGRGSLMAAIAARGKVSGEEVTSSVEASGAANDQAKDDSSPKEAAVPEAKPAVEASGAETNQAKGDNHAKTGGPPKDPSSPASPGRGGLMAAIQAGSSAQG